MGFVSHLIYAIETIELVRLMTHAQNLIGEPLDTHRSLALPMRRQKVYYETAAGVSVAELHPIGCEEVNNCEKYTHFCGNPLN